jgi:hypothetical protein
MPSSKRSNKNPVKYVFQTDGDCHWYKVPVTKLKRFNKVLHEAERTDDFNDFIEEFDQYRTGGGINDIEFYDASEMEEILEKAWKYDELCK